MRHRLAVTAVLALLLTPLPSAAGTIVLDAMTDPLPPNPCLPNSGQHVVFLGEFCDGTACPPDPIAITGPACNDVEQSGLPGVRHGFTRMTMLFGADDHASSISIVPALTHADASVSSSDGDQVNFYYRPDASPWTADLASLGITALRTSVAGDVSATHPILCALRLVDAHYNAASVEQTVGEPGVVVVPLASMTQDPDFDLTSIQRVDVEFYDCPEYSCGAPVAPRRFQVGPISFGTDDATAVTKRTWGSLKAAYR